MTDPIDQITVTAHPLGNELIVRWIYPSTIPDDYSIYVFKRKDSAPSQAEIDDYFNSDVTASGLTVFDDISAASRELNDFDVENGETYYYSAVIYDNDESEASDPESASGSPGFTGTTYVIDSKELAVEAIKRILSNYDAENYKDYEIRKDHSIENVTPPLIVVIRQSANDVQRVWGNILKDEHSSQWFGRIEQDHLLIMWEDKSSERRDTLTNVFRSHEETFRRYLIENSNGLIKEVVTQIGSDDIDPRFDLIMHTGQMLISITLDSFIEQADQREKHQFDDVEHNGNFS